MTDPLGQSQVLPYIIGLTQKGYQFTLISFEKPKNFKQGREMIQNICHQHNINWLPQMYTKKPPIVSTIRDIRKLQKVAFAQHQEKNFELVHCRSYITSLVGLRLKQKKGIKFIFDMRGFWADERLDGHIWNRNNPIHRFIYKYFKKKEKEFLSSADYIISLTHNAKKLIHSWQNIPNQPLPVKVIPCCVDLDLFKKDNIDIAKLDTLRKRLGIREEDFTLGYLGSIGTWYMLDEMLDYFKVLKQHYSNAKFLFITRESSKVILEKANFRKINTQDIIIESAKRAEVPYYLRLCDFSIFFIKPVFSKRASSPTKQGEIMAMGIPIICNTEVGDTDKVINDYQAGILVEDFSEDAYSKTVSLMNQEWSADKITEGARSFYSLENGIEKYATIYDSLLKQAE